MGTCGCEAGSAAKTQLVPFVYVAGRIRPHFPSLAIEREFSHALGDQWPHGGPDAATLYKILSKPENKDIARQICWIFDLDGVDSFAVAPSDPADILELLASLKARADNKHDYDIVIGSYTGDQVSCGNVQLPLVSFDQLATIDTGDLINSLPVPTGIPEDKFRKHARALFELLLDRAARSGATDERRAITFLTFRSHTIYDRFAEAVEAGERLVCVDACRSKISEVRNVLDIVFGYETDKAAVDKHAARVDVSEEFPFLFGELAPVLM